MPARRPLLGNSGRHAGLTRSPHRARRLCGAAGARRGAPCEPSRLREWPSHPRSREGPPGRTTRRWLPIAPLPTNGVGCAQAIEGWVCGVWGCLRAADLARGAPPRVGRSPTPPPKWGRAPLHRPNDWPTEKPTERAETTLTDRATDGPPEPQARQVGR